MAGTGREPVGRCLSGNVSEGRKPRCALAVGWPEGRG